MTDEITPGAADRAGPGGPEATARDGLDPDADAGDEELARAICRRWGLDVAAIGDPTAEGRPRVRWNGEVLPEVPLDARAGGAPDPAGPATPPSPAPTAVDPATLPAQPDLAAALLQLLARPAIAAASRARGSTSSERALGPDPSAVRRVEAVRPGRGAALVRLEADDPRRARRRLAVAFAAKVRWCLLDPYLGAEHAVAECARRIACVGGEPLAGAVRLGPAGPATPERARRLAESVRGIGDAARALGTPLVAGDLPLRGEAEGALPPDGPAVGMIGLVEPVDETCSGAFRSAGDVIALVGSIQGEVGGSEYLAAEYGAEAGRPPALDLARERAVQETVRRAVREGLLSSACGCADGGLAVALAECCLAGAAPEGSTPAGVGCAVRIPFPVRKDFVLFGEDASRVLVSLPREHAGRFVALAQACGAPVIRLGAVGGDRLVVESALDVPVAELAKAWRGEAEPSAGSR